jgi:hypothetical protein
MAELNIEGLLRSTAAATVYPATPDLRMAVERRLRGQALSLTLFQRAREYAGGRFLWMPRLAFTAMIIAVIAVAASLAIEPSREAIARFFGVQGSRIEVLPPEAFPTPLPTIALRDGGPATPTPLSALVESGVAEAVPLGVVAAETGFLPALPPAFGTAEHAYVVRYGGESVGVLEYESFELWQAQLEGSAGFGKGIAEGSIFEDVLVGGVPGHWLSGGPHFVWYNDRFGRYIDASSRLVEKNTLIWRTDYAFYRIETDLPLEDALKIAVTLP